MTRNLIALQNRFLGQGETVYDRLAQIAHEHGAVSDEAIDALAKEVNLPPSLVRSVAKFYDDLRSTEPSAKRLNLCNGEACFAAGSEPCKNKLSAACNDSVSVGDVTCLGYCGDGPVALLESSGQSDVFSLRDVDLLQLAESVSAGKAHGLSEPNNKLYPASGTANLLLRRMTEGDVTSLASAKSAGIYAAFESALKADPEAVLHEIEASKLRGRGGAGFPAGRKLRTVATAPDKGGKRYVVVNADEGDAGAYIDKELLEQDPHTVIEGTLLAAFAVGSSEGFLYLRAEYPRAQRVVARALEEARQAGLLGDDILGSGFSFELHLVLGHGAYICGEETSLLRSLEGVPAQVSPKPPYPAIEGYKGQPTAVHNVESLACYPVIMAMGGAAYAELGFEGSRGTKLVSLNAAVKRPGLYEVEMGISLRRIIFDLAGGMAEGLTFKAVQVGGPLGGILTEDQLDLPLDFESFSKAGALLGHAGIVVFDDSVDMIQVGRGLMKFCAVESCGKCFPCRIGSLRGTEIFDKILDGRGQQADLDLLAELNETMRLGSLCALGGAIPLPMDNLLRGFIPEFQRYIADAKTPEILDGDEP
ncbi:MAG: NAD(P)H-dependent oxidoreductase subunit E [Myxococcota bacterium]|nr:NAD(P)H-dependent oxidoreductase subunit E [Myxococcota bacterium]